MSDLKRTPLYPLYGNYPGSRCIDFGGWELPVQFSGIQKEHEAVRERAGLFDVSHMGEFLAEGPRSLAFLQRMLTNDASLLLPGKAQYTLMCNPEGGVIDDLLVYMLEENKYMLVVNAGNLEEDWSWLNQHLPENGVNLTNRSAETALLALQGPLAVTILENLTDSDPASLRPFAFHSHAVVGGISVLLSRSGYTGEDGFELYVSVEKAQQLWELLLEAGTRYGCVPAGLGARDTLRFEACLPLHGQELSSSITPLEAGLHRFVKWDKGDFIGRSALEKEHTERSTRKLVGLRMLERGIPRSHYPVFAQGEAEPIGEITTGAPSPTLKENLGLALIDIVHTTEGTVLEVDIRGKRLKAEVVSTPCYRRRKNKTITPEGDAK